MRSKLYSLIIFSAKFIVSVMLLVGPAQALIPYYSQLLASQMSWLLPEATVYTRDQVIIIDQDPLNAQFHTNSMSASFVLLIALFFASPHPNLKRRLLFLSLAMILQVAYHLLDIFVSFNATYNAIESNQKEIYKLANLFGGILERAFPVMIWALLMWRSWFPKPVTPTVVTTASQTNRGLKEARP